MVRYILMFHYTQQGMQNIKESPARVETAKQAIRRIGGEVKEFYMVMGHHHYDTVFIVDAPNDEAVAKASFAISSLGSVRAEILRTFTENEFKEIVDALPHIF